MVKKRKVELYDILANRLNESEGADLADNSSLLTDKIKRRQRTGREILLSLDGAFVILVVGLLLLGTAYFMGFRKGLAEANLKFRQGNESVVSRSSSALELVKENRANLRDSLVISPDKFTLKVLTVNKSSATLARLRSIRMSLLANPVISNSRLEVFIMSGSKVYSLVVGLYERRDDEVLVNLRQYFKENGKREIAGYKGVTVESIRDLGKPLL